MTSMPLREALAVALTALAEVDSTPERAAAQESIAQYLAVPAAVLEVKIKNKPVRYSGNDAAACITAFRADIEQRAEAGGHPIVAVRTTSRYTYRLGWPGEQRADLCLDVTREPVMDIITSGSIAKVLDALCYRMLTPGRHWVCLPD